MKRFFKFLGGLFLVLIIAFVIFFFWASSATLDESEYVKISQNDDFIIPKNDSIFTIMTYNIGYLSGMTNNRAVVRSKDFIGKNLENVKSEIEYLQPDIIAFQEIDYNASRSYEINQEKEIADLGYRFRATAVNWDERYLPFPYWPPKLQFGKVLSGQSVVSKYPIQNNERIVLQRVADASFYRDAFYLERLAQVVKVNINNKEIVVINVHLEAFDELTRKNQFEEVLEIFNRYKNDFPVILLGDFNSPAHEKDAAIHQLLNDETLGSAAFDEDSIKNTFDSHHPFKRIDYIFYTKNSIEYISGKVATEFGEASDHLPVFMEFRFY